MAQRVIRLPNGHRCTLGTYIASWRALKALPTDASVRGFDHFGMAASEILRDLHRGLHDRINRHDTAYGRGRKWDQDWQVETRRTARAVQHAEAGDTLAADGMAWAVCPPDFRRPSMTCEPNYAGQFVNVYLVDRSYGGPEEGGWYYDCGEAISSDQYATDEAADQALEEKRRWCAEENSQRRSDIGSVLSEGRFTVYLEDAPAADYPCTAPHYE